MFPLARIVDVSLLGVDAMANVKNKSVAERTSRRRRYINAIDPLRDLYKCTAAQVYGMVMGDLNRSQQEIDNGKERIKELEEVFGKLLEEKKEVESERTVAIRANETSSNQVVRLQEQVGQLQEQLEALSQRLFRQDRQIELLTEENKDLAIRCGESS